MDFSSIDAQIVEAEWLTDKKIFLNVLRLDKLHTVVSGNKWFKLKYYLQEAQNLYKSTVATFGGAWSNHIVATACAAKQSGVKSVGIIRGEQPVVLSNTLKDAVEYGMQLQFVARDQYKSKEVIKALYPENWYWIDEGGYGVMGAKGAAEILRITDTSQYTHIVAAVGTGTMVAGLLMSAEPAQTIVGISSMKGNYSINGKIRPLIASVNDPSFEIFHDYHFGGYGKHPPSLISFINEVYLKHNLPLDIIYTGKTFFAIKDLVEKSFFKPGSKVLMIHSGGLQGNRSLPEKVLSF